jgi:transcription elongation GreA/GreB family factor
LSVAFTKEDSAETASEILLPDRPVSPHPNLVTEAGLKALEFQLREAREAHETAQKIEDVNERRRQAAIPLRDARYFAARVRTAQIIPNPASTDTVAFGSTVTFKRDDGRVQKYRIVGEDEADPKAGSISFVSPVATSDGQSCWGCRQCLRSGARDHCDFVAPRISRSLKSTWSFSNALQCNLTEEFSSHDRSTAPY